MIPVLKKWFFKYFSDPQAVVLAVLLILGFGIIFYFGTMLAPVLAGMVIAYMLDGFVQLLERQRIPRFAAVLFVFFLFMALLLFLALGLFPLLSRQVTELIKALPDIVSRSQEQLMLLPQRYPEFVRADQIERLMAGVRGMFDALAERAVSISVASIQGLVTVVIYMILLPLLVFFFLKDKRQLVDWLASFLPRERKVARQVWREMDAQIGNYVRGKFWEVVIVGGVTYTVFSFMQLQFAALLALLVGLSVIVPYVGAAVVTFPVAIIAYFQWGWTSEFFYLMLAYSIVQALDGNVLVPLLFSEAVNLHPVAIIVAVLFFGGIWGFWGIFFAIPLATLVRAVIVTWPRTPQPDEPAELPAG